MRSRAETAVIMKRVREESDDEESMDGCSGAWSDFGDAESSSIMTNSQENIGSEWRFQDIHGGRFEAFLPCKRTQMSRITTEIHQKTVHMMMEAARELAAREKLGGGSTFEQNSALQNSETQLQQSPVETFTQKPYW